MRGRFLRFACAVTVMLICSQFPISAQAGELAPVWARDFGQPIDWQQVTATGQLIVSTPAGLYSIDPADGSPLWSVPSLGRLGRSSFEELPGTPLAMIVDDRDAERVQVLNVFNGAIVFDSRAEGLAEIASTHVLARSGSLLIAGFESGNPQPTLFLYDIEDGTRRWSADVLDSGMGALASLLVSAALVTTDLTPVQSAPLELGDGTFLLGAMGNLYRFDVQSGKVIWKASFTGGSYELLHADLHPDIVLAAATETDTMFGGDEAQQYTSTSYQAFSLDDGRPAWIRPVKFNQMMSELVIPLESGFIVSEADSGKGRVHLLDRATGERMWGRRGRGISVNGRIVDYAAVGNDLILTTGYDSIWTNKDTEYQLYVLDPSAGAFRFEDPVKTRGRLLETELTDRGLVYVTTHEINVFDPASGSLLSDPVLTAREPLVTVNDGRAIYAYHSGDGLLYRFDRDTGAVSQVSKASFELPDHDSARSLDVGDDRITLLGRQTIAGFTHDGDLLFEAHYKAPRDPAWLRSLAWAEGIRAGMASAYAGIYSAAAANAAANASEGSVGQQFAQELERGFGELHEGYAGLAGDFIGFARRRYEASAEAREFAFMMVQDDDRRVSLASISKRNGTIESHIALGRDKEPDYQVDDITGSVFYSPTDSTIRAYRFAAR